ncbi:SURF1 family protein [Sphingomonas hankyongi]|uniref:SURF1-like protein n=1 Tax=Sphingomonas hankyongi TaxID=2908209 RepID=A0ABT0S086_9SPHN|nr:SURF1 family protein [Sphingomonas hankyongi]MCL6729207.1 SURF1 family protein [Sphingomonas hankyongi]
MMRRLAIPTIIVAASVALMVALGIWQLHRAAWKESLLARYDQAQRLPPITWPTTPLADDQLPLFRHATGVCLSPVGKRAVAGHSVGGEPGYVQVIDCSTGAEGPGMSVEVGWSKNPNAITSWRGGPVSGIIAPDSRTRMRLVAASPAPGLQPSAPPSTAAIPNNHRLYAIQWFSFATIALIIYGMAARKRLKQEARPK